MKKNIVGFSLISKACKGFSLITTLLRKNVVSESGFSLIEILVVIALFAVVGLLSSEILLTSLRNSRKSEAVVNVRTNLEHSLSVMERQIRGVANINSCTATRFSYTDTEGASTFFQCIKVANRGYIASGSANVALTNSTVDVDCTQVFSCDLATGTQTVNITLTGQDTTNTGAEGAKATVQTKILIRN